jgi:GT2 family glycosyltransferase/glycosyltransferase involved in cell wall biosynthesis
MRHPVARFRRDVRPAARPPVDKPELDIEIALARVRAAWRHGEALAASGDAQGALAWLEYAHRQAPADQNLAFALAWQRLRAGDADGASRSFGDMARRHGTRECWIGFAAACLQAGRISAAAEAAQAGLSTTAASPAWVSLAASIARAAELAGWCGLQSDGVLLAQAGRAALSIHLDGCKIDPLPCGDGAYHLPPAWRSAAALEVRGGGVMLLGSPIAPASIMRVEGFVTRSLDGITGWAWHPNAPDLDPELRLVLEAGEGAPEQITAFTADAVMATVEGTVPLARPRPFACPVPVGRVVRVIGGDGRDLLGSRLMPVQDAIAAPARASRRKLPVAPPALAVDVVIPVYRGLRTTLDCIAAVIATVAAPNRILVVDDASPEPALVAALADLAASGAVRLLRTQGGGRNLGFPAAVNAGMREAAGRHVVLLNSDTLVAPGWLEALRDAACSAPAIGTATPMSNEASIFSYPAVAGGNPPPDLAGTRQLAALAAQVNAGRLVDVPTAHGFCMFIRRDCLDDVGLFDERLFAQGYGEENDFSERAGARGWRHVAVPGVYVAHVGGVSLGTARHHLLRRNLQILEQRHPGYAARVARFIQGDALAPARRRLDAARFARAIPAMAGAAAQSSVLLVTHGGGGGTTRVVAERAAWLSAQGLRPIVLRAVDGLCEIGRPDLSEAAAGRFPNLTYVLPAELPALARLLIAERPMAAELHHLLGHHHSVLELFARLAIPYDVWVHDYAWFCARLSFVTGEGRFCGEAEPAVCDDCVSRWGRGIEDPVAPAALRRRSETDLRGARTVIVPSGDVARRVARHVPGLSAVVRPWEADPAYQAPAVARAGLPIRVAVVGAIGIDKGFDVLLACARDAAARRLELEFVVVGYTVDDDALLATGRAFVTGEFKPAEARGLIMTRAAHFAFLPSIWPETWCYALTDIWAAGLSAVVFDIGTPAGRVRESGRGWVLPLGLPAPGVNDALLSFAGRQALETSGIET